MTDLAWELDLGLAYEDELVEPSPGWAERDRPQAPPPAPGRPMTREQALASLARYEARHGKKGTRKAYAALGDDVTFSRFVKVRGSAQGRGHAKLRQPKLPGMTNDAVDLGRSVFRNKGVKRLDQLGNLLVSGHSNVKIGRDVRKGLFRGYHIYTLTLEERATCPSSCRHWVSCYGNNMPWARRVGVTPENRMEFEQRLAQEVRQLLSVRDRAGVLVRLHALGDFFDPDYVRFWLWLLGQCPTLAVYGYTARRPDDLIGAVIAEGKAQFGRRFAIRWSDGDLGTDCTASIDAEEDCPPTAFVCPEQTGRADACGKCGVCWTGTKNVAFVTH